MELTNSPKNVMAAPLTGYSPERLDKTTKARIMTARYSGGPKAKAAFPQSGAKN
jgi:hypothetical protein